MNTMIRKLVCWLTPAVIAYSTVALAQEKPPGYPLRPIRIIISVAPGAGADLIARATAQILKDRWGQNAVVDSRPGGGGVIATELAAKAPADGYTILQYGDGMVLLGATKRFVCGFPMEKFSSITFRRRPKKTRAARCPTKQSSVRDTDR